MEWKRRSAYVFIKTRTGKAEYVCEKLNQWEHTIGTFMVHYPWDVMVWFDAKDIEETHKWVSEIRDYAEVEWTSTQHVFNGYKRDYWFWEYETCAWAKIRSKNMQATYDDLMNYDYVCTYSSIPGDWDCIAMICGNTWEETLNRMGELKNQGYEIECYTPYRWWWNKSWEKRWYDSEAYAYNK